MNETEMNSMKLGVLLHDFLMNSDYDINKIEDAKKMINKLDICKLKKTNIFIERYLSLKINLINRRSILDEFEEVAEEIAKFIFNIENNETSKLIENNFERKLSFEHYKNYSILISFAWSCKDLGNITDDFKMVVRDYLQYEDSAINGALIRFYEKDTETRDVFYEVFYVLSSDSINRSVFSWNTKVREIYG